MTAGSTGSEETEGEHQRLGQHVALLVASPVVAAVGMVAAVAQVLDYLQDQKAGLVGLVVTALAAVVCIVIGWQRRRSLRVRMASVDWPGYVVYGSALLGAMSLVAAAVTVVFSGAPNGINAGPTPPPVPTPNPSTPVTSLQPTAQPTTTNASVPPLADGVTCGAAASDKVTISSVYSADERAELDDDVVVAFTIQEPPTAGATYWLMVYADDNPRNLHHVWQKLAPDDTAVRHTITAGVGSHREIYVAESSPENEAWFVENLKTDRDYSWDGNRVELPTDAQKVSNTCDATRKR